jgi:hypothetical protein
VQLSVLTIWGGNRCDDLLTRNGILRIRGGEGFGLEDQFEGNR